MTDKQDPITHAARLLREAAEELRQAHAYSNSEGWENETDAKAAYDEHLAAAQALEDWEAAVGAGGVSGPLMGIAAPPTAQAEWWVNVDERLPAKNTEVLICFAESTLPSTGQYTGHAADPAGWCYPKESYLWPGESEKLPDGGAPTVTHWMPLPPPPTSAEGVEHG